MPDTSSVTAIIVNYRIASSALRAAASINDQGMSVDIHIIDNSELPQEAELLRQSCWSIQVSKANIGFAAACNRIYAETRSKYVLLLNPDARMLPGALSRLVALMQDDQSVAAVAPRTWWDEQQRLLLPPVLAPSGFELVLSSLPGPPGRLARRCLSLSRRRRSLKFWLADSPLTQTVLSGGQLLLRRSAIDAAGGLFDPGYFLYWEDVDLFARLRRLNMRSLMVPDVGVIHPAGSCARAAGIEVSDIASRSQARYWSLHYPHSASLAGWFEERRKVHRSGTNASDTMTDRLPLTDPLSIKIPRAWHADWCLELSTEPQFLWPLALFGSGPKIRLPIFRPDWVDSGGCYIRLGPVSSSSCLLPVWRIQMHDA